MANTQMWVGRDALNGRRPSAQAQACLAEIASRYMQSQFTNRAARKAARILERRSGANSTVTGTTAAEDAQITYNQATKMMDLMRHIAAMTRRNMVGGAKQRNITASSMVVSTRTYRQSSADSRVTKAC